MLGFPANGAAMQKRLDGLQRNLAGLIDTASEDERAELREIQHPDGWRRGGTLTLPHGNAAAALELIATAEDAEWGGTLPQGSAENLREQLRARLIGIA
jgi:hypothetical protein